MAKRKPPGRLTAGELEILELLWREGPLTIAQAHEGFGQIGYTTVQTRLNRLAAKGVVEKSDERPARYRAAVARDEVTRSDLGTLVRLVSGGRVVPLVAHLVNSQPLSAAEIKDLKQLIADAEQRRVKTARKEGR